MDLVITEDSDLIAYGCSKILFKLDQKGTGMEFSRQDLFLSSSFSFRNFTEDMILSFCILLGCDFLKNPKFWGWKRLFPLIEQGKTPSQIIDLVCKNACLDNSCVFFYLFILDISKISLGLFTRFGIKSFSIL